MLRGNDAREDLAAAGGAEEGTAAAWPRGAAGRARFFLKCLGSVPAASAGEPGVDPKAALKTRRRRDLFDATLPIRSGPSALAAGMRRKVTKNRFLAPKGRPVRGRQRRRLHPPARQGPPSSSTSSSPPPLAPTVAAEPPTSVAAPSSRAAAAAVRREAASSDSARRSIFNKLGTVNDLCTLFFDNFSLSSNFPRGADGERPRGLDRYREGGVGKVAATTRL